MLKWLILFCVGCRFFLFRLMLLGMVAMWINIFSSRQNPLFVFCMNIPPNTRNIRIWRMRFYFIEKSSCVMEFIWPFFERVQTQTQAHTNGVQWVRVFERVCVGRRQMRWQKVESSEWCAIDIITSWFWQNSDKQKNSPTSKTIQNFYWFKL